MLVIKRKIGESLIIFDNVTGEELIKVIYTSKKGSAANLGIKADEQKFHIEREENAREYARSRIQKGNN